MEDHLDKETSASVELTESGVKAKVKSRFVAAVDRLGGNLVELVNAPIERNISRQRATFAGETDLIRATTNYGIDKLRQDPEFADRAVEKYFGRIFKMQENKDGVLREALDDLRHTPPSDEASLSGGGHLAEDFLERFDRYAESASTEKLRQKWGRVLSSEVRRPGTFSLKVLRTVDEIDAETAETFERLCSSRVRDSLPKCLVGKLSFSELSRLIMSGLVLDPGVSGHIVRFAKQTRSGGGEVWALIDQNEAASFSATATIPPPDSESLAPIIVTEEGPAIPVYLLTDSGDAIAGIFPTKIPSAFSQYIEKLRTAMPGVDVVRYTKSPNGDRYQPISDGQ